MSLSRLTPSRPCLALALAVMLAALSTHASANGASSTSHITDFSFELIDLNPADGIAPALTFTSHDYSSESRYYPGGGPTPFQDKDLQRIQTLGSTAITWPEGFASTSTDGSQWHASSALTGGVDEPTIYGSNGYTGWFRLTPSTQVVFKLAGTLESNKGTQPSRAQSGASLEVDARKFGMDWNETYFSEYANLESGSEAFLLTGSVRSGDEEQAGRIYLTNFASTVLYTPTTPVPEPAGYAMLALGAGIIGALARRRRRT